MLPGVPLLVLLYQAHSSGLSLGQMFAHVFRGARQADIAEGPAALARGQKIDFPKPMPIGFPSTEPPRIGSLEIVDLDKDGLPEVQVADMLANRVGWIRQYPAGVYNVDQPGAAGPSTRERRRFQWRWPPGPGRGSMP